MKTYEATGKTYEEALQGGLTALGATISDVTIDVLEEGSKGLFGLFGSRPYKVRLTVKEDLEDDPLADLFAKPEAKKPEKKAEKKPAPKDDMKPEAEKKPAPKADVKPEAPKAEAEKKAEPKADVKPEAKEEAPKPVQRKAKPQQPKAEGENAEKADKPEKKQSRPRKERKPEGEKKAEPRKAEKKSEPREIKPLEKPVVTMIPDDQVDAESAAGKAQAFLKELTHLMGVDVEVAIGTDAENNVFAQMTGDTLGILIGRRGETLDAIQYLTSLKVNRGQEGYTRVTLDTENYRAKREDTLIRLANRMANRAVKTGRKVALEPMNPYERRIIHSALQANEAVDTHSEGEEPNRHVVITLRK